MCWPPRCPPVGDIKYQKLVSKVSGNLSQNQKLVSSSNEGIEDPLGRPKGPKTGFLVKSATKMAPVTPPVSPGG